MLNVALLPQIRNALNPFTAKLVQILSCQECVQVKTRNGTLVKVQYQAGDGNDNDPLFFANDWEMCWNANGSSSNSARMDLVEIVTYTLTP
jgi:hypothetical protein